MDEEKRLVEGLRAGNEAATVCLMDRYGSDILRTAVLMLGDRHLAEDVSQETFILAYRRIGQFRGEGSLRGWLLRIAVQLCRSSMRKAAWKRLFLNLTVTDDDMAQSDAFERRPAPQPGDAEWADRMTLREEIGKLPFKYREVVVLHYFHDLRTADIAEVLGEPEGTVKSKLMRARGKLKQQLQEGGWEHGRTLGG
ncbi:sigma-70 family RNA polymerase sigma factor [Paenibacillus sp. PL2-23]|uniref:RNA polymerase sigma factor n=1 Tax=Paenibacillus sp. PL2-23 TaxID=2100729 RepID=UPI0030FC3497